MPDVQVPKERSREIVEAHRQWLRTLPREPGQIGGTIGSLVEGPPIYVEGLIETYSDFPPVCFYGVDPGFLRYLREQRIPVQIFDNGRLQD